MVTIASYYTEMFTKSHEMFSIKVQLPEQCFSQDQMVVFVSFHVTATPHPDFDSY